MLGRRWQERIDYCGKQTEQTIFSGFPNDDPYDFKGTSVITPVIPLLLVVVPAVTLAVKSEENLFESYPLLFVLTFGLIASKISNKLVVSRLHASIKKADSRLTLFPLVLGRTHVQE